MSNENIIYIGRKPVMNYVLAVLTNFNQGKMGKVTLQARGRAISTAVDAAEVTRNRYMPHLTSNVKIGTEKMSGLDGDTRNVSTINIVLTDSDHNDNTVSKTVDSVVEEIEIPEEKEIFDTTEAGDESSGEE